MNLVTPCQLPELSKIKSISVNHSQYWPLTLELSSNPRSLKVFRWSRCNLLVKRRSNGLGNPKTNFFVQSDLDLEKFLDEEHLRRETSDPMMLSFAKIFCAEGTTAEVIQRFLFYFILLPVIKPFMPTKIHQVRETPVLVCFHLRRLLDERQA